MLAEISSLWPWLLACFAIGAGAGAVSRRTPENGVIARWLIWTALAFGVGALVVHLGALADAATFIKGALAAYAIFIVGAALGALLRHGSMSAHEGWAVGLIAAALVWVGAMLIERSDYGAEMGRRYAQPIEGAGVDSPIAAAAPPVEAPTVSAATLPADAKPSGPAEPMSGGMTLVDCQAALEESSTSSDLVFRKGDAQITLSAAHALDKAAAIIRRCPQNATIEIIGHVRGSAPKAHNDALAQRRAQAAIGYLERQGVNGRRLVASRGEPQQLESQAITFEVR
ncbi:OmpA family protein [Methylocystis sp. B8]|uniref:OmpA family protein n=1 Tax=Methylocystis sp. B8 TaxID=544938 RepID=UPI0010FD8A71|nr:OmpA family protein [Methylocystis sp. B8]TLG76989.1 OmpA family protein [Methylocystis sp. B8]